jgi:hypothetical protein
MSNNDFNYCGLSSVARALKEIGHPDAQRLLDEAEAYRQDMRKAFFEAMRKREILHSVECPNNDLFVYGPRRMRREPNAHELRAEARYNWIAGGEERALTHGRQVLQRLLESAAREEDADYEIRRRRNEISKGPRP